MSGKSAVKTAMFLFLALAIGLVAMKAISEDPKNDAAVESKEKSGTRSASSAAGLEVIPVPNTEGNGSPIGSAGNPHAPGGGVQSGGGPPGSAPTTLPSGSSGIHPPLTGAPSDIPAPGQASASAPRKLAEISSSSSYYQIFTLSPNAKSFRVVWDMKGSGNRVDLRDMPEGLSPIEAMNSPQPAKGEAVYPPGAGTYVVSAEGTSDWKVTVYEG